MTPPPRTPIGATVLPEGGTLFRLWAPAAERVELVLDDAPPSREMRPHERGYWELVVPDATPDARYAFALDGGPPRPDPASRCQPQGPHGPSAVIDPTFDWTDHAWRNPGLESHVFYELHIGAFTEAGTFDGAIERLDALRDLGVTALQLMPIAEFPGARNWGYDGVSLFAAHSAYGGPDGLRRLVDAAHARGLAVYLDVVYNHLGPEGNYLREFGPYFTDRYRTPWGEAINFSGRDSDEVRNFFIENALYWTGPMHLDGLRLDAVHAIVDPTASPFVRELSEAVHARAAAEGRRVHVIAESASNDPRVIRSADAGGLGCDAQWNDDFHHALRAALTGERRGYYAPFGRPSHLADAYRRGFVFIGQHNAYRGRRHGAPPEAAPDSAFLVFAQNHDQVGNRMRGDRLGEAVDFESLKLAAAAVALSPFVPMLFMGEEFAASTAFPYFVSHTDPELVEAVRRGRAEEFASFDWAGEPPDPQAEATFQSATLDWTEPERGRHAVMLALHRRLLELRRALDLGSWNDRASRRVECRDETGVVLVVRRRGRATCALALNLGEEPARAAIVADHPLVCPLDTADERWGGPRGSDGPTPPDAGVVRFGLARRSARLLITEETR